MKPRNVPFFGIVLLASCIVTASAGAADALDDLSLEELTKTEISSVSRRSQNLANVPAAAFVISAEDIRRSGAHALPEVLRMVPGIEVAQIDNGRYAVSARGFNGRFASKLQVLVDGRSIYSPFFSGVMWEHDPVALDDIERIEVIRGPGAAMWGANAVNGVINIITRHSAAQSGGLLAPTAGSNGFGQIYGRYSGRIDTDTSWKLSFQGRHMEPSKLHISRSEGEDRLNNGQINFRFDRNMEGGSSLALWASASKMELGDLVWVDLTPAIPAELRPIALKQSDESHTVAGRYRWLMGSVESSLQMSATQLRVDLENKFRKDQQTFDLDYQGRYAFGTHDLLWGLTHRINTDESVSNTIALTISRQEFTQRTTGIFVHDEWTLLPERLQFGVGARWEHDNLGGATFSPNAALMWTPSRANSAWVRYAAAPRIPARAENHVSAMATFTPAIFPTNPAVLIRNGTSLEPLKPEKMESLELGYRSQLASNFSANLAVYRQRYSDRVSGGLGAADLSKLSTLFLVEQYVDLCNCSGGWINGAELAADWLVTPAWRLQLSLTTTRLDMNKAETPVAIEHNIESERGTPRYYGSLRSQWNISANRQFDAWLRGSAGYELPHAPYGGLIKVPGYVTLDLRYAHRLSKSLEVSISGRNLIGGRRNEFIAEYVPSVPVSIGSSLLVGLRWGF